MRGYTEGTRANSALLFDNGTFVRAVVSAILTLCLAIPFSAHASSPLAMAARTNDTSEFEALISAGEDVNIPEPDGTTALLWAVYNSNLAMVKSLLDAGADPDTPNTLDITPLLMASRYGNADMIQTLLDSGASIDHSALAVEPLIMAAARAGSVDAVNVLLEAGANPNDMEPLDNQTAIMWAAAEGHLDVAKALLDAGADPDMRGRINTLTKRKNADFPTGGFAAMHWAARNGDREMIDLLLDKGADINVINGDKASPMMLAIVNDRFDLARHMLERGADANDGSLYYATIMRDGTTDWMAMDGTVFRANHDNEIDALELTALLLEAGADPNKPFIGQMHNASMCCDYKSNQTPFYRAAKSADIAGMKLMLEHGGDSNWKPASETRPVGIDGEEEVVSQSALMVATTGGKGVGRQGGPNDLRYGPPPFREEGVRDQVQAVMMLLEAGADVNIPGPDGRTALHVAAKELEPAIVRALVEHGADLDAVNDDGKTALQVVEEMDRPEPTPGFYFEEPAAWPEDMIALLTELGATPTQE